VPAKPAAAKLPEEQRALHALNRLTFGPRPGDLEKVMAMGVDDWVEQQLHPDEINNSALDAKLNPFRTLRMQTRDLVQTFPTNNMARAVAKRESSDAHGSHQARDLGGAGQDSRRTAAPGAVGKGGKGS
jgi:hypothetical protein